MLDFIPAHIFAQIINILIGIGMALTVIFIIISGIQFITSMGNEEKTKRAKRSFMNAIIGFIVVVGSIAAVYMMGNTLGGNSFMQQFRFIVPF